MQRTNDEILKDLEQNEGSTNAMVVRVFLRDWDTTQTFPYHELIRYIKFHQWENKDFEYDTERWIKKKLPNFVHDIFFKMKFFKSNVNNDLTSEQEAYAKLCSYPNTTFEDKSFIVYNFYLQRYYEHSQIHEGECNYAQ